MFRIGIALIAMGGFGTYYGFNEYSVGASASAEPVAAELSDLEAGQAPDNHLTVGSHWAIYPTAVGWGDEDSDELDYLYYPVVSETHPYNQAWDALAEKYPDGNVPDGERPTLTSLGLLVKTKRFESLGDVPDQWAEEPSVTGLLVHDIDGLKSSEIGFLQEAYPDLALDSVMILEEGREPSSTMMAMLMMLGGVGAALGGLIVLGRSFMGN